MKKINSLVLIIISNCMTLYAFEITDIDINNIEIVKYISTSSSYVTIIRDKTSEYLYCVKQFKGKKRKSLSLLEALASYVAENTNIPVNKVRIIPDTVSFPGKFYPEEYATLHTFMPGIPVKLLNHPFQYVDIKQFKPKKKLFGVVQKIISDMAQHPDLPPIVSFDTFVGGTNHSNINIFYDEETNNFYGIDLEKSFAANLSEYSLHNIKTIVKKNSLDNKEWNGLFIFYQTFKKLYQKNTPEKLDKKLDKITRKASKNHSVFTIYHIKRTKKIIKESYQSSLKLINLLEKIFINYMNKTPRSSG